MFSVDGRKDLISMRYNYFVLNLKCYPNDKRRGISNLPESIDGIIHACRFCLMPRHEQVFALAEDNGRLAFRHTQTNNLLLEKAKAHGYIIFDIAWMPGKTKLITNKNETSRLVFKEGVLVDAMRKGHWIILDELNLAPSDALEVLNRILDDKELFIPETQQNCTSLNELRQILHERYNSIPPSFCEQVIDVMRDLQIRRKNTAVFADKKGFITLRDLLRWSERFRLVSKPYDWR